MTIAAYPMVEEEDATGRVAAVYAAALQDAPFVPSLLKSLAVCPPYLVLAWEQARPVLQAPETADAVDGLVASVRGAATAPAAPGDRELLGGFVTPLGRMLLLSCGLLAAGEDRLPGCAPATGAVPPAPAEAPRRSVPTLDELPAHAEGFGRIRAALGTPIVNSIWRRLAAEDRLERVWDELEPQAAATRERASDLRSAAATAAASLPWEVAATPAALRDAGIADAGPGMATILRAYTQTLSRVLVLVASSAGDAGDR